MENSRSISKCPECGGIDLIRDYESDELVCEECGFVVSSTSVDYGPEWRAFNIEQQRSRSRVGSPSTWVMHDKGLSTRIGWRGRDAYGRMLKPKQKAKVYRLRKWHNRTRASGSTQRNLSVALSSMIKIGNKLHLPKNVVETASMIYRQAIQKNVIRGRSIEGVVAAALYMACRQCGVIRKMEEVGDAVRITKKEVGRIYRFLLKILDTDVPLYEIRRYVSKFVNHLSLSGDAEILALKVLDQAVDLKLTSGRGRSGIAAAVTYIASKLTNEHRTQSDVAKEAGVTEVTIRNRYKELMGEVEIIVEL